MKNKCFEDIIHGKSILKMVAYNAKSIFIHVIVKAKVENCIQILNIKLTKIQTNFSRTSNFYKGRQILQFQATFIHIFIKVGCQQLPQRRR